MGLPGFAGKDDLVMGSVTGVRWWKVHPGGLAGAYGHIWCHGRNEARCGKSHPNRWPHNVTWINGEPVALEQPDRPNEENHVPGDHCECGFWAYWDLKENFFSYDNGHILVCGIIEGTGRVLIGERGFRSQYAEITALHVEFPWEQELQSLWAPALNTLKQQYPDTRFYTDPARMLADHPTDREDAT